MLNEHLVAYFHLEGKIRQEHISVVPRKGDLITITGQRDENGSYLNADNHSANRFRHIMQGTVIKIEHCFCGRGWNSSNYETTHFVEIELE